MSSFLRALVLVETSMAGNLGAALRVAANLGVDEVRLVSPRVDVDGEEVARWACGARDHLRVSHHPTLSAATADCRCLLATASGRGREGQPVVGPRDAVAHLRHIGAGHAALVMGNESRGLSREDLDHCDLVVRIPTREEFPVLNVTQATAILLGYFALEGDPGPATGPSPAPAAAVEGLMGHLRTTLLDIGFLDPRNPERILRKLRRLLGRAGVTSNEVAILRGICRQVTWAAHRSDPGRW